MKNVYVITGGASGIGYAAAKYLPRDNSLIIISGRSESKLIDAKKSLSEEGINVEYYVCDTSDRNQVKDLAKYASEKGIIKGVINSAGVSGTGQTAENVLRINALGTVYINQEFYNVMSNGCICDVASCSAYTLPNMLIPHKIYPIAFRNESLFIKKMLKKVSITGSKNASQLAYCISKNFVTWYVKQASYKYAKEKNIRVVSVSPGFVHTPMTVKEKDQAGTELCLHYSGFDRGANAEEIGFLIGSIVDERNSYLTGVDILCDGGCISAGFGIKVINDSNNRPTIKENW